MANTFALVISSAEKTYFDGQAVSLTVPGEAGSLCLLAHHAPIAAVLGPGTMQYRLDADPAVRSLRLKGVNFLSCGQGICRVFLENPPAE
jgi:F0F1-type ATP synthase epsilon subunit